MSGKKALVVGLAAVLLVTALGMVACGGGDDEGKKAMQAALDVIEADIESLTATMTAGGDVASLKTAKNEVAPHWQAVVDAAEKVEGADKVKAQQLWDDVSAAIDGVPDNATLLELAGAAMGPFTALQTYVGELREMVGPSGAE